MHMDLTHMTILLPSGDTIKVHAIVSLERILCDTTITLIWKFWYSVIILIHEWRLAKSTN